MDTFVGRTIGEYRLTGRLGSGGMGEVYRAVHTRLGRTAAVKLLRGLDPSLTASERFLNEARVQASLNHPNIAVLYEFCDVGACPCIIMEYVDGQTLDELIRRRGRLPAADALAMFRKIVQAIQYVHEHGIIHRDIKPNNIKVTSRGDVKLLDFGISRASFSPNLTGDGRLIGTGQYLAPEQLQGEPATALSDIWALGALWYEMVTGRTAFEGSSWGDLFQRISNASYTAPSTVVPSLPKPLDGIIARCLRKNPKQRYPSAGVLLEELDRLEGMLGNRDAETVSGQGRVIPWRFPGIALLRPWWAVPIVLVLLLAGGGGYYLTRDRHQTPRATVEDVSRKVVPSDVPGAVKAPDAPDHAENLRPILIDVMGEPAELTICREGKCTGPYMTPHRFTAPIGTRLDLVLRRPGFQEKRKSINVQVDNRFMETLCRPQEYCP